MYVVYLNSRKKQDATAHLKVACHLNAGDANATYKLYFGGSGNQSTMRPDIYFIERRPTEVELRAHIGGELGPMSRIWWCIGQGRS